MPEELSGPSPSPSRGTFRVQTLLLPCALMAAAISTLHMSVGPTRSSWSFASSRTNQTTEDPARAVAVEGPNTKRPDIMIPALPARDSPPPVSVRSSKGKGKGQEAQRLDTFPWLFQHQQLSRNTSSGFRPCGTSSSHWLDSRLPPLPVSDGFRKKAIVRVFHNVCISTFDMISTQDAIPSHPMRFLSDSWDDVIALRRDPNFDVSSPVLNAPRGEARKAEAERLCAASPLDVALVHLTTLPHCNMFHTVYRLMAVLGLGLRLIDWGLNVSTLVLVDTVVFIPRMKVIRVGDASTTLRCAPTVMYLADAVARVLGGQQQGAVPVLATFGYRPPDDVLRVLLDMDRTPPAVRAPLSANSDPLDPPAWTIPKFNQSVCFRRVVMGMEPAAIKQARTPYFHRAASLLRDQLMKDTDTDASTTPRAARGSMAGGAKLRLVLISRLTQRRFTNEEAMVAALESLAASHRIDFAVARFENLTMSQQTAIVAGTNVLVGMSGAALVWSFMQSPHSVVLEVNYAGHSNAPNNGLDVNTASYFGAIAVVAGIHHSVLRVAQSDIVSTSANCGGACDVRTPIDRFMLAVRCSVCVALVEGKPTSFPSSVNPVAGATTKGECCSQKW